MNPDDYVARVRELVGRKEYAAALDLADRHGPVVEDQLTLEQWGTLGSLLKHAELVETAKEARSPARVTAP